MICKSRKILPAVETGSIDQQSDFPMLTDERIDLWCDLAKVVSFQFLRRNDPQRIGGDNLGLDHAKTPSWSRWFSTPGRPGPQYKPWSYGRTAIAGPNEKPRPASGGDGGRPGLPFRDGARGGTRAFAIPAWTMK